MVKQKHRKYKLIEKKLAEGVPYRIIEDEWPSVVGAENRWCDGGPETSSIIRKAGSVFLCRACARAYGLRW